MTSHDTISGTHTHPIAQRNSAGRRRITRARYDPHPNRQRNSAVHGDLRWPPST
jgi:hypothetical protein